MQELRLRQQLEQAFEDAGIEKRASGPAMIALHVYLFGKPIPPDWELTEKTLEEALENAKRPVVMPRVVEVLEFYARQKLTYGTDIGGEAREALGLLGKRDN